jgi:hypothetical protein
MFIITFWNFQGNNVSIFHQRKRFYYEQFFRISLMEFLYLDKEYL